MNTADITEETMIEAEPLYVDRQKDQMLGGMNKEGRRIGKYRSSSYRNMKMQMNPIANGFVDLRLTGDFFKSIYAEVRGEKIIIDATDEKTQSLANKYGETIFGLNKDTKRELIKDVRPIFMRRVKSSLGL